MRRLAVIAVLLALAAPAAAQQGRIGEVAPEGDLRGAVEPETPPPSFLPPSPIALGAPPAFSAVPSANPDAGRCRMSCAQDHYFCLSQDDATECDPGWRACLLTCGISATPAAPGV